MADIDGYMVAMRDKTMLSGYRYVMAYNDKDTAEFLLSKEKERNVNKGLVVIPFKLIHD